jgi:hypothetical protein
MDRSNESRHLARLKENEAVFDLANEFGKARVCDDLGVPTLVALNQVVGLHQV